MRVSMLRIAALIMKFQDLLEMKDSSRDMGSNLYCYAESRLNYLNKLLRMQRPVKP